MSEPPNLPPMATSLDLQEQEQLDAVKAFWNQYGNLITSVFYFCVVTAHHQKI